MPLRPWHSHPVPGFQALASRNTSKKTLGDRAFTATAAQAQTLEQSAPLLDRTQLQTSFDEGSEDPSPPYSIIEINFHTRNRFVFSPQRFEVHCAVKCNLLTRCRNRFSLLVAMIHTVTSSTFSSIRYKTFQSISIFCIFYINYQ